LAGSEGGARKQGKNPVLKKGGEVGVGKQKKERRGKSDRGRLPQSSQEIFSIEAFS